MSKGISLHIGLNSIDPSHYGTSGELRACENDANAMKNIADRLGYTSSVILTKQATSKRILSDLAIAAQSLEANDILWLTYSGHGAQIPDKTNDENDGYDETWCLYDRMLIDDELYNIWSRFKPGVRIIVLSDSCHSGTVSRVLNINGEMVKIYTDNLIYRCLPIEISEAVYHQHSYLYDTLKASIPTESRATLPCSVLLISGCQDNQLSGDGVKYGVFTGALLKVWESFTGTYRFLHQEILKAMPSTQTPNYSFIGVPNEFFEKQMPFSINDKSENRGNGTINEADWKPLTYRIDLDETMLSKMNEQEMTNYFNENVIKNMVDGYKKFKVVSNQILFTTRGGEIHADVHCDTHGGGCDVHVGGSIRF